jgi:hypothetical protein
MQFVEYKVDIGSVDAVFIIVIAPKRTLVSLLQPLLQTLRMEYMLTRHFLHNIPINKLTQANGALMLCLSSPTLKNILFSE